MNISIAQLEDLLSNLPGKIRDQEIKTIEAEKKVDEAKLAFDICYGMALVKAKKPNATEKKAEAEITSEPKSQELIEAKYNYKKEHAALRFLENRFVAMRKIGSLEERLMQANISGN